MKRGADWKAGSITRNGDVLALVGIGMMIAKRRAPVWLARRYTVCIEQSWMEVPRARLLMFNDVRDVRGTPVANRHKSGT